MRWLRCCLSSFLCACILFGLSSVGAYALEDEQSYLNDDPVDLYVMQDGVMTLADITGYQVLTYFQGRGSTHKSYFTDTLTLDTTYREGYIVIQITLPSGAYLPKNSVFDLSLKYNMSTVSSVSAKAVLYGPNYVSAGDDPTVEVNTSSNIIQFNEAQNNKSQLSIIEIWLTLSGMEWRESIPTGNFYINNHSLTYELGMTWRDWINSSYNTIGGYPHPVEDGDIWITIVNTTPAYPQFNYFVSGSGVKTSFVYSDSNFTTQVFADDLINNQTYYIFDTVPYSNINYEFDFEVVSINISTLDETELQGGILGWIKNIFNSIKNLPQNIADKIKAFFEMLGDKITDLGNVLLDGIKGLFIPSEESLTEIKEDFEQLLADRFGAVYESSAVIDNFANAFLGQAQISTLSENSGIIHFPLVTVSLVGVDFSFGGWDIDIIPDGFDGIVDVLKVIIDIVCTFAFVNALRKRLEAILR